MLHQNECWKTGTKDTRGTFKLVCRTKTDNSMPKKNPNRQIIVQTQKKLRKTND